MNLRGFPGASAAIWILVLNSPAAAQGLFFLPAVFLQCSGGAGMGPNHRAAGNQEFHIRVKGTEGEKAFPCTFTAPPGKASANTVPSAVFLWKKPPLCAASHYPKDSFGIQADRSFLFRINTGLILQKSLYFQPLSV
ncbi:MAG: hypothetical protein R2941_25715 [Desulfobacterales bacterium]